MEVTRVETGLTSCIIIGGDRETRHISKAVGNDLTEEKTQNAVRKALTVKSEKRAQSSDYSRYCLLLVDVAGVIGNSGVRGWQNIDLSSFEIRSSRHNYTRWEGLVHKGTPSTSWRTELTNQKNIGPIIAGGLGALAILALVFESGVLPLAIFLGLVAFGATWFASRDLKTSALTGGGTTGVASLLGVLAMLSPGWYQNLL